MNGPVYSTNGLFDLRLVARRQIWAADELVRVGRCLFCGNEDCPEVAIRQDGLVIHECSVCGLAYIDPRPGPEQLARYYSDGYFNGAKDFFQNKDYCLERDNAIRTEAVTGYREIVNHLDISGKRVLDIGCASGALLYLMRECGAGEVVGIDSAAYPIAFGIENYGLDLRCSDLENARLPDAHFDLITLIDVIEHVENLPSLLSELRRVLRPGGHVFIVTPNYLGYFLARDKWTCLYKDFEHLQYFSEQSLREVFRSVGIRLLKFWTESVPFRTFGYPHLYRSGIHRLLHPLVAAKNTLAQTRYKRAMATQLYAGSNLIAVLQGK
ncbi:MAG: hypothetical protein JWM21_1381 [Acidobacteria bacterium]|nr:hypothetical protein [Acidobacteriota bacterium]